MSVESSFLRLAHLPLTAEGVQEFNRLVFGSPLHPGQLRVTVEANRETNLISPGNSWGKTEWIVRDAVWRCWNKLSAKGPLGPAEWLRADYRALVCSYQFDIAKESYQRLLNRYEQGGLLNLLVAEVVRSDPPRFTFTNGAILDFGSLDRGGRHVEATRRQVIYVDEVGHMPDFKTIYTDILYPRTIGVGGMVFLLGTPKPQTDAWLFDIALEATSNPDSYYYFYEGSSFENTFWPAKERERVMRNPELFHQGVLERLRRDGLDVHDPKVLLEYGALTEAGQQVVLGKFVLTSGLYFRPQHVARMFSGAHSWYVPPPGKSVTAWDTAGSKTGGDATVGLTLDLSVQPWQVSRLVHIPAGDASWSERYDLMQACYEEDRPQVVAVDVTGAGGDAISEELEKRGLPVEPIHLGGNAGVKKLGILRNLQSRMEMEGPGFVGWVRFPSVREHPELVERKREFDHYRLDDAKIRQDTVMALAMAVQVACDSWLPDPVYGQVL